MFRFMQRFGRDSQARRRGTGPMTRVRRRNHPLNCEALEGRQLLSAYYIVNAASGKVLDDPGGSTSNGTPIDQWQLNGGANQQWNLVRLPNGNYAIVNEASGKVLDDPSFSTNDGTGMIQWSRKAGPNQQWTPSRCRTATMRSSTCIATRCSTTRFSTSNGTPIDPVPVERGTERGVGAVGGG